VHSLIFSSSGAVVAHRHQLTLKTLEENSTMLIQFPDVSKRVLENAGLTPGEATKLQTDYADYMNQYASHFLIKPQFDHFCNYGLGLMGNTDRKSVEPMALELVGEKYVRSLQQFMTRSPWPTGSVLDTLQNILLSNTTGKVKMITVDPTDFKKKGNHSVGVAKQYRGSDGKVDTCQVAVFCGLVGIDFYHLIDYKLYMCKQWFEDDHKNLWNECQIPDTVEFATKNEQAIEMIRSINNKMEIKAEFVGGDCSFGHDSAFRDSIPDGLNFFLDIHSNDYFYTIIPELSIPDWSGRGRKPFKPAPNIAPVKVAKIIEDSEIPWSDVCFGLGSKGLILGKEKLVRIYDVRNDGSVIPLWLYARRFDDGKIRYSISNAPEDTPLQKFSELAKMRWPIEQSFEECKLNLGLDHFEGRSWHGWHRHVLIVLVIHYFLQLMRAKYSVNVDQLSEKGQIIIKGVIDDDKSKVPVLTLSNMCLLISAAMMGENLFQKALAKVKYWQGKYADSFLSFLKEKALKIPKMFKKIFGIEPKVFCSL
jgi:SRSO17 transposase